MLKKKQINEKFEKNLFNFYAIIHEDGAPAL